MADRKQIHEFALKWRDTFRDQNINSTELLNRFIAEDCAIWGFESDSGRAFEAQYGNAVYKHEELEKVINDVTDISLLGSTIYSRWCYFNHGPYKEILESGNRTWFITALTRLIELTKVDDDETCSIILFPDFQALKEEVEKLRTEISMLVLERDELLFVKCKNIEMAYMLAVGNLEYKAYELHCAVLRLKRKIELIQARKNRQEKVVLSAIEKTLDQEFAQYKARLDEQINKMNDALERSKCIVLSDEDTKEMKKLYRSIVKSLHPDLHPDITEAQVTLFYNAVSAYENGDLNSLRIIGAMVSEQILSDGEENGIAILVKERERLTHLLQVIRDKIEEIKNTYPYTMKSFIQSEDKIAEKKAELEDIISQLNEALQLYKSRIAEMLR